MEENKKVFEPDVWIIFKIQNKTCIGRTAIIESNEIVTLITEDNQFGRILFKDIVDPQKLSFTGNLKKSKEEKQNDYEQPLNFGPDYKNLSLLAFTKGDGVC